MVSSRKSKLGSGLADRMKICVKRKANLKKKIYELSTLCGIDSCMIFYGPNGNLLATWPENHREVEAFLERYNNLSSDDRQKRNLDLSSFNEPERKKPIIENTEKKPKIQKDLLYPTWDDRYDKFPVEKLRVMEGLLESKLERMKERVESQKFLTMNKQMSSTYGMNNRDGLLPSSYSGLDQFCGNPPSSTFYGVPNWFASSSSSSSSTGPNYPMSSNCNFPGYVQMMVNDDPSLTMNSSSSDDKKQDYDLPPLPHSLTIPYQPQPLSGYLPALLVREAQPVHQYSFQPAQTRYQMQHYQLRDGGFLNYYSHH